MKKKSHKEAAKAFLRKNWKSIAALAATTIFISRVTGAKGLAIVILD